MTSPPPWQSEAIKEAEFRSNFPAGGTDECWLWTGPGSIYGGMYWPSHGGTDAAHRIAFQLAHGRLIQPGLCIDHVCEQKLCMNPDHLEEVTREENLRRMGQRRAHCARDHARSEHGYTDPRGSRRCRACDADPNKERLSTWTYRRPDLGFVIAEEGRS